MGTEITVELILTGETLRDCFSPLPGKFAMSELKKSAEARNSLMEAVFEPAVYTLLRSLQDSKELHGAEVYTIDIKLKGAKYGDL